MFFGPEDPKSNNPIKSKVRAIEQRWGLSPTDDLTFVGAYAAEIQ